MDSQNSQSVHTDESNREKISVKQREKVLYALTLAKEYFDSKSSTTKKERWIQRRIESALGWSRHEPR